MAKRNIFEMLGLEFDPPDNVKKIRAAYETWKKRLTAEQNTTVDPTRLAEIRAELQMDEYISVMIDNPRFRQHEAESLKQQRVEELRLYIDIQRGNTQGTLQVNQTQIRQIRDKLRLSQATIEATYKEQGFEIKPAKSAQKILSMLNNFFLPDSVLEELRKNFAAFRTVPDAKNFPWSANVHDLYELAFYIEQIETKPSFYYHRSTDDLREIFRDAAKKFSAPIPQWQSIKALLNLAQTQVFNNDDSRFKYDHSRKIETLEDFFAKIKAAPEMFKRDGNFADNCINQIRQTFPNFLTYELSAALYNKAAGLLKNPYEATVDAGENSFCVTCANCGAFESFRTREESERARCKICGESFFVECPKCGKKIPATAEHCTACDFSIAELKKFSNYVAEANSMLDLVEQARNADEDVHIVTAEIIKILAKAKLLKPESNDLKKIEWRINKTASELKKRELFAWAEKKLPSLSIAPAKAVSDCVEILRKIKDYKPAVDRLKLIPPKAPPTLVATLRENYLPVNHSSIGKISVKAKSTSAGSSANNLICNVSWQAPADLGITYTLIKKIDGVPQTYRDGEILIENSDKLEFVDTDVKAGVLYGYAIFSTRLGTISAPTTATAVHYSDLDEKKLIAKTEGGACKFIWRLPSENCLGIRILRSDSAGKSVIVTDCDKTLSFTDKAVKNREQYQYRLQCVYYAVEDNAANNEKYFSRQNEEIAGKRNLERNYKYSHGLTVTLTPEQPPKPVENLICTVKGGRAFFSWKSTGDFSIWFKEVVKEPAQIDKKLFELDNVDELLGSGVVYKKAESTDETCEFALSNETVKIAVISATRELGLVNEIFTCANVEPCEIDAAKTQIDSGGLKLVLKSVPENLYLIHYKINTRDADELYATIETAKARQMNRIYATKYVQDTFITQSNLAKKEIFITVIGEYKFSDGTNAYCAPSTLTLDNRPKEIISYRLEWGTSGLFKKEIHAKDCKLIIESRAKPTPKMYLVCRRDGRMNIELGDSATRTLGTIRTYPEGYDGGRLEIDLPNDTWKDISSGTVVKLLTSKEDARRFDLKATRPDSLTVPKK
ncbi:MAG: zinc ribbon domain-containing protein [Selenomonadaceae bacterium]|nr:zinc ribbon domain-containing protein [Selenomonadaceae bacterium]